MRHHSVEWFAASLLLVACVAGCAPRAISLPVDLGQPLANPSDVHAALSSTCRGIRTFTAELGLSGRAGRSRVGGRVHAGFDTAKGAMRLEGVAPFGPPAFILAGAPEGAVLYLPRDERILRHPEAADVLEILSGVSLSPSGLLAVVTGCVVPDAHAEGGRQHANGWVSVALGGGASVFARRQGPVWHVQGARLDAWNIAYDVVEGGLPRVLRLQSTGATSRPVSLRVAVSQIETNVTLHPATFDVTVSPRAQSLTLDELRDTTALREVP